MNYVVYGILSAVLLAHAFIACTATVVVLKDNTLDWLQVIFKISASWIVLYVGPLFVLYVMNQHSPHLVPKYAQSGLLHAIFFGPIKPPRHGENPTGNDGGSYQNSDASDLGIGGEGSCGAGGD